MVTNTETTEHSLYPSPGFKKSVLFLKISMFPNHPKTQAFLFKTYGCLETFFDVNKLSNVVHACICVLSCFRGLLLFVTLWTVAHQASLPMQFSRQEYGNGIFLTLGKNLHLLPLLLNWQAGSLPLATWEAPVMKWFGTV